MEKLAAKLISLCALVLLTLIFSVVPYFLVLRGSRSLVSHRRRDKVIALLNCFGGGVFLGTLLLHLLTEGAEEFEMYKSKAGWKTEFPLFHVFVAGGFFLVAFIEFFVHSHLRHGMTPNVYVHPEEDLSHEQSSATESQYGAVDSHRREVQPRAEYSTPVQKRGSSCADHLETDEFLNFKHNYQQCEPVTVAADCTNVEAHVTDRLLQRKPCSQSCETVSVTNDNIHPPETMGVIAELPDGLRAFLLLFALSFHTIFDGLAVGLQDSVSEVWQVFIAISIHKSVIAFCLGLEMFKCHLSTPWRAFFWICFFSVMCPLGVGLGIGLTSGAINEMAKLLSSSILQGVAAGTFLYVTFLEILNLYIGHNCDRKFLHIFAAMVGFNFMACVKLFD